MSGTAIPTPYTALSLWQPWATLVIIGAKKFETRSWKWPAHKKGTRLAVHAAQKKNAATFKICMKEPFKSAMLKAGAYFNEPCPLGAVLGIVEVRDCYTTVEALSNGMISADEEAFGDYREFDDQGKRRYCTELRVLERFKTPYPCKGRQGFFTWVKPA